MTLKRSGTPCWGLWLLCLVTAMLGTNGCRTTPSPAAPPPPPALAPTHFEPMTYVATVEAGRGQAATLYAPTSFAVWVGPEVTALKRQRDIERGAHIEPYIDQAAQAIPADYIVLEVHAESAFPDSSLAYDAVTFRNVETYLEVPDASGDIRRLLPVQTLIGEVEETPRGTLRAYSRTNLLVFPREDILTGRTAVPVGTPGVRLVLDAAGTDFAFSFPGAPAGHTGRWSPEAEEALRAAQLGYRQIYGRLLRLAHIFD